MANPKFTIIIPLWNGSSVILDCLRHLYQNSEDNIQVICVDNASSDDSVALVASDYPMVRVLKNVVNLGFAGGVNRGIDEATGDNFILLNQDCLVQPGWLAAFTKAIEENPDAGIAGCLIYNADGSVNHAGASIERPSGFGTHVTGEIPKRPQYVEYVTGAVFLIRRATMSSVGRFDEDFYPVYHEEVDYCYRAAACGFKILLVPGASAKHLFSSLESQKEPVRYVSIQHQNRYRFVAKHFNEEEIGLFFAFEQDTIQNERHLAPLTAKYLAVNRILHAIVPVLEKRSQDLQVAYSVARQRQLQRGFTQMLTLLATALSKPSQALSDRFANQIDALSQVVDSFDLHQLAEQTQWNKLYIRESEPSRNSWLYRIRWPRIRRLISVLTGREQHLMVALAEMQSYQLINLGQVERGNIDTFNTLQNRINALEERLHLLETASDYEFR